MAEAKTYLNVPFAEKDVAKALGARWDPAQKKWYVPPGKELGLFAQWQMSEDSASQPSVRQKPAATVADSASTEGVFTYPTGKDFIAYSGSEPPWL